MLPIVEVHRTIASGMPTIMDRVNQGILRMTIEPIAEYHFLDCLYGFKPKRCCQDAIEHIFIKMAIRNRHQYVIEGDIKGCFDNISHDSILKKMLTTGSLIASFAKLIVMLENLRAARFLCG